MMEERFETVPCHAFGGGTTRARAGAAELLTRMRLRAAFGVRVLTTLVLAGLTLHGCVTVPTTTAQRVQPQFDYTPPETAPPGSADVTFAVVGARFENPATSFGVFGDFAGSMASDFDEMVIARGYTVRGPFRSHDEMTYPEKSGSDLVLTATVDFTPDTSGLVIREAGGLGTVLAVLGSSNSSSSASTVSVGGQMVINTRVTLVVSESVTNERMWAKSVSLDPLRVDIVAERSYARDQITLARLLANEAKFYTDLGRALEGQYADVMRSTWGYLDPAEMRIVKRQSLEVRERKVFQ